MLNETFFLDQIPDLPPKGVRLAVLGHPIKHSISPQLHESALAVLAEKEPAFHNWNYRKIEVPPEDLYTALPKLAKLGFRGLNLTIPHKVKVLPILSSIDQQAQVMGAVNTLSWESNGWKGYNTDGIGLSRAIKQAFGRAITEFDILVLGAGGAARAAVAQCLFEKCQNLAIFNRSLDRAKELCRALKENDFEQNLIVLESFSNPFSHSGNPTLIINATSLGLRQDDPSPIDLSQFSGTPFVYDMVYNPPVTNLLRQAAEMEYPWANGLGMLVGQAARSLEIWTGREVSTDAMSKAAEESIGE